MDWFTGNAHWVWLTLGLVLAGLSLCVFMITGLVLLYYYVPLFRT